MGWLESPLHHDALGLLDDGFETPVVAARMDLNLAELAALVHVAEAKVERILQERATSPPEPDRPTSTQCPE